MTGAASERSRRAWRAAAVTAGAIAAVAVALALASWQWAVALQADGRLLPGTVVADVAVGTETVEDARAHAARALDGRLDDPLTVTAADAEWTVTARELGAAPATEEALEAALAAAQSPSWIEVARAVFLRGDRAVVRPVAVTLPADAGVDHVDEVASTVDRAPRDADLEWSPAGLEVVAEEAGRHVNRPAAVRVLRAAVRDGQDEVGLPVTTDAPRVDAGTAAALAPAVEAAIELQLDRVVTLRHGDHTWDVTHRALGARPDAGFVLRRLLEGRGLLGQPDHANVPAAADSAVAAPIPFTADRNAVATVVDDIAAELDRDPRDADIDYSSGRIAVVDERTGRAVERDAAATAVAEAVADGVDSVDLPVRRIEPETTRDDFHHVLLVRQDERRLYLYIDGEVSHEWAVAIGTGNSPTPTGRFTMGLKRHLPTWHNPAPDGWGADMPAVVGPGPGNPLGVRALNWDRNGHDTLIRFHGTSDVGSIGRAASRGCVRLTNPDVVELYDLVDSGTPIVSIWG